MSDGYDYCPMIAHVATTEDGEVLLALCKDGETPDDATVRWPLNPFQAVNLGRELIAQSQNALRKGDKRGNVA